jgi:hypothetical protein
LGGQIGPAPPAVPALAPRRPVQPDPVGAEVRRGRKRRGLRSRRRGGFGARSRRRRRARRRRRRRRRRGRRQRAGRAHDDDLSALALLSLPFRFLCLAPLLLRGRSPASCLSLTSLDRRAEEAGGKSPSPPRQRLATQPVRVLATHSRSRCHCQLSSGRNSSVTDTAITVGRS